LGEITIEFLYIVILIILGLISVLSPETAWHMSHGWRFKDAEPSDLSLTINKIIGTLALGISGLLIIFSLGSCIGRNSVGSYFISQFTEDNIEKVSVTYNLRNTTQLDEKQIGDFISIMTSGVKLEIPSKDEGLISMSGTYILEAEISFKDGTEARLSTTGSDFNIGFEGKSYYLKSRELVSYLLSTANKE
jgi:hypothetical protein